jgi:hypothetical protein
VLTYSAQPSAIFSFVTERGHLVDSWFSRQQRVSIQKVHRLQLMTITHQCKAHTCIHSSLSSNSMLYPDVHSQASPLLVYQAHRSNHNGLIQSLRDWLARNSQSHTCHKPPSNALLPPPAIDHTRKYRTHVPPSQIQTRGTTHTASCHEHSILTNRTQQQNQNIRASEHQSMLNIILRAHNIEE